MKRTPLSIGTTIQAEDGLSYTYIIDRVIGDGASSIVYEAHYFDNVGGRHDARLKECYPYASDVLRNGNDLEWSGQLVRTADKEAFTTAYHKLLDFQNTQKLRNSTAHIFDLFEANGTVYSVMDVNEGITFEKDNSDKLSDILKTMLALSRVVEKYHEKGYLHLDIKPSNFLVIPETRELVILFDVDSVTSMADLASGKVKCVPFSNGWAAPEQKQGRINKLCPATDIYSIGAILFQKVMGRAAENEDIGVFSDWELDGRIFEGINPKVKRLLRNIFRKTLSANFKRRYQSANELIDALEEAVDIVCNKKAYIISQYPSCSNYFVGRESELLTLHTALMQENHLVFVHGEGGIGKSELVKKYLEIHSRTFDAISFVRYQGSFEDAINEISIKHKTEYNDTFDALNDACNEETLIVLDNFDVAVDQASKLKKLFSLNAKIIITTRTDFSEVYPNSAYINLTGLGYSNLKQVFELNSGYQLSLADTQQLRKIFILGEECTYFVELIAKLMKRGMYTISEISSMAIQGIPDLEKVIVSKDGEIKKQTIFRALQELFRLSDLDSCQWEIFMFLIGTRNLALTTRQFVDFIKLHCPHRRTEVIDAINTLAELGYIQLHNERLVVRDIIYDIIKTSEDLSLSQNELIRIFLEKEFVEPSRVDVEYDDEIGNAQLKYNFKCLFAVFSTVLSRKIDDLTYIVDILFDLVGGREDYIAQIWNRYSEYVLKRVMFVTKNTAFAPFTRIKANCIILTVTAYQTRIGFGEKVKDETLNLMRKSEEFFHAAVTLMKEYDLFDSTIIDKLCLPYMEMSSRTLRFNMIDAKTIDTIIQLNPTKLKSGNFPEHDFDIQALRNLNYQKYYLKGVWERIQACKDQEENKYTAYNACMRIFMNGKRAESILDDEHFDLMEKVYGVCRDMFLDGNAIFDSEKIEIHPECPMQIFVLPAARIFANILWGEKEECDKQDCDKQDWFITASQENIAEIVNSHPDFKSFSLKLDTFDDLENAFKLAKTTNDTGNKLRNFNEWLRYSLGCLDPKKYIDDGFFSSKPNVLTEILNDCERLLSLSSIKQELNVDEDYHRKVGILTVYEKEYRDVLSHSIVLFCLLGDEEAAAQKFNILMQLSKAYLDCVDCEDITKINHSTMDYDVHFWGTINRLARLGYSKFALPFLLEYVDYVRDYYSINEEDERDLYELYGEIVALTKKAYEELCPTAEERLLTIIFSETEEYSARAKMLDYYQSIIKTYSTKTRKITNSKYDEQIDQLEQNKKLQILEATTDSE